MVIVFETLEYREFFSEKLSNKDRLSAIIVSGCRHILITIFTLDDTGQLLFRRREQRL